MEELEEGGADQRHKDVLEQQGWYSAENLFKAIADLSGRNLIIDIGGEGDRAVKLLKKNPRVGVITINKSPEEFFFWTRIGKGARIPRCPDKNRQRLVVGDAAELFLSLPKDSLKANIEISHLSEEATTNIEINNLPKDYPRGSERLTDLNPYETLTDYLILLFSIIRSLVIGSSITILEPQQLISNIKQKIGKWPGLIIQIKKMGPKEIQNSQRTNYYNESVDWVLMTIIKAE